MACSPCSSFKQYWTVGATYIQNPTMTRCGQTYPVAAITLLVLVLLTTPQPGRAGTYEDATSLMDKLLTKSGYKTQVRPLLNQSDNMDVYLVFELLTIVGVNDVTQSFTCNGFMAFFWYDQILRWNSSEYGGEDMMTLPSKDVFRPRISLLNTMGERDIFSEDQAPVIVDSNGLVEWIPGSIFHIACKLDLTNYPFDEQTCDLDMTAMDYGPSKLTFVSIVETVGQTFYVENGEWKLLSSTLTAQVVMIGDNPTSSVIVSFSLRRKPEFLVISVLLPIVFLSLLNLMVFVIPVDSGEKISFGITVLLALSVFLSITSQMLPRSSESMPLMIRYIFCLLIISLLTVVISIIIVRLHHMEETTKKAGQEVPTVEPTNFSSLTAKVTTSRHRYAASQLNDNGLFHEDEDSSSRSTTNLNKAKVHEKVKSNRCKTLAKHTDLVSAVLFGLVWVAVTVEFFISSGARV